LHIDVEGLHCRSASPHYPANKGAPALLNLPAFEPDQTSPFTTMSGAELALGIVGAVAAIDVAIK
jgi:hypothetical protein